MGNYGPNYSKAYRVSGDGSVVVGHSIGVNGVEAFSWTSMDGLVGLGDLPGGDFDSTAYAVSADSKVIVGVGNSEAGMEAFRWTQTDGMVGLGAPPYGFTNASAAFDVSADGSVVVGQFGYLSVGDSIYPPQFAFRWTMEDGMIDLGALSAVSNSIARAVSADGSVVVGASTSDSAPPQAFIWTEGDGMLGLGVLPGGSQSGAFDVSADGSVVVGYSYNFENRPEAIRWTETEGMKGLGYLPNDLNPSSFASATSRDGSIVVGYSNSDRGYEAFIWTADEGMQSLNDYLVANGIDMTGWFLSEARGISDDGTVIVGIGSNPDGNIEGWIVQLDSAPITHTLNLSVNGEGTINSEPGSDMQCTGNCAEEYLEGTIVTLTANPTNNYSFAGWTGDCRGIGNCILTMGTAKNVTATFLEIVPNPIILEGSSGSFTTIQYVYDSIASGQFATIKVKAGLQASENLMFDRDVTIRIEGGYDHIFTNIIGDTSFYGTLTISDGHATISDLIIK